jgi:hypothetical protein
LGRVRFYRVLLLDLQTLSPSVSWLRGGMTQRDFRSV